MERVKRAVTPSSVVNLSAVPSRGGGIRTLLSSGAHLTGPNRPLLARLHDVVSVRALLPLGKGKEKKVIEDGGIGNRTWVD